MAIQFHPRQGQLLLCDFSKGFQEPEMVKTGRPVIVVSPKSKSGRKLVTVVALSTVEPNPVEQYHYKIPKSSMPQLGRFQESDTWVKGDMIYTVGFHRLNLIRLGKRNPETSKRLYFDQRLGRAQMIEIYSCVLNGLGLGKIAEHL